MADERVVVEQRRASLVDVLDRTLRTGVAVRADLVLSIAGIDLVTVDLRAVLGSSFVVRRHEPVVALASADANDSTDQASDDGR